MNSYKEAEPGFLDLPLVLTVACPFFRDVHHCRIQHF